MRLTDEMKKHLLSIGYRREDFAQIERAGDVTTYEREGREISADNARRLLGTKAWLSGLGRSAFHWDAARIDRYGKIISFDSRKLYN